MIDIDLIEDSEERGLGVYRFQTAPSPGDRVAISTPSGSIDIYEVAYLEHAPVRIPTLTTSARTDPHLVAVITFLRTEMPE